MGRVRSAKYIGNEKKIRGHAVRLSKHINKSLIIVYRNIFFTNLAKSMDICTQNDLSDAPIRVDLL